MGVTYAVLTGSIVLSSAVYSVSIQPLYPNLHKLCLKCYLMYQLVISCLLFSTRIKNSSFEGNVLLGLILDNTIF
jgi:hypothetical protein